VSANGWFAIGPAASGAPWMGFPRTSPHNVGLERGSSRFQSRDKACASPKLYAVAVNELPSMFERSVVI